MTVPNQTAEMHRAIGRIEGRLDTIIELLKDRNARDDAGLLREKTMNSFGFERSSSLNQTAEFRMKIFLMAAGLSLVLTSCASPIEVVSQTPASIELKCTTLVEGCSAQAIADQAQAHCRRIGQNAVQGSIAASPSGSRWVTYRCVP
jgi:hypothetical protein